MAQALQLAFTCTLPAGVKVGSDLTPFMAGVQPPAKDLYKLKVTKIEVSPGDKPTHGLKISVEGTILEGARTKLEHVGKQIGTSIFMPGSEDKDSAVEFKLRKFMGLLLAMGKPMETVVKQIEKIKAGQPLALKFAEDAVLYLFYAPAAVEGAFSVRDPADPAKWVEYAEGKLEFDDSQAHKGKSEGKDGKAAGKKDKAAAPPVEDDLDDGPAEGKATATAAAGAKGSAKGDPMAEFD